MSTSNHEQRIRRAWQGRVTGCQLGKPVELLSMRGGHAQLKSYLEQAAGHNAVRDYIPYIEGFDMVRQDWCAGGFDRSHLSVLGHTPGWLHAGTATHSRPLPHANNTNEHSNRHAISARTVYPDSDRDPNANTYQNGGAPHA